MRLRHLSEKTAFLLLGFLVLGACGKDDPEPPVPGSGEGLLRVSVRHTGDTPLAVFAYKADGSRVAGKEEPAGTPSTWSWSERLVVGEYALLVAGADPAEVRLGDTENLGKAYAAALPSGSDSLLVSLDSPLYVESVTGIKVTDGYPPDLAPYHRRGERLRRGEGGGPFGWDSLVGAPVRPDSDRSGCARP